METTWIWCLSILLTVCYCAEYPRFDGWYNNLNNHHFGAVKSHLIYKAKPQYDDGVYTLAGKNRPPPGLVSSVLLTGERGLTSSRNLSALFAFFGQLVSGEIISTISSGIIGCPAESIPFKIGDFHYCPNNGTTANTNRSNSCPHGKLRGMPFFRVEYDKATGWHLNNPRTPINHVSSFIDGSFIYGVTQSWADSLRNFTDGRLKEEQEWPHENAANVPLNNPNPPEQHPHLLPPQRLFLLGSFKSNQNPPLLLLNILLHRYHNRMAGRFQGNPNWSEEEKFQKARQLAVAHLQSIIMYEYAPLFMDEQMPPYRGYNPSVDPRISVEFQVAAFRIGHSLIPSMIYSVNQDCVFKPLRICKFWWDSQSALEENNLESLLRGLLIQPAERTDHIFSDAVQERLFSGLRMNRGDLVAANIQRGREEGVADYNTVRRAFGLAEVTRWEDINPRLYEENQTVFDVLRDIYNNSLNNLDLYTGGLLESQDDRPGPLFKAILLDQFVRLRDGDRFWFENLGNGLFNDADVDYIRTVKLRDVLLLTTTLQESDVQVDTFLTSSVSCPYPSPNDLPIADQCSEPENYDFFSGSEISFVIIFAIIVAIPICCCLIGCIIAAKRDHHGRIKQVAADKTNPAGTLRMSDCFAACLYVGPTMKDLRKVQIKFGPDTGIHIMNRAAKRLRSLDLSGFKCLITQSSQSFTLGQVLIVKIPHSYDVNLIFLSADDRQEFVSQLHEFFDNDERKLTEEVHDDAVKLLNNCVTEGKRKSMLENFFKTAFDQVFNATMKHSVVKLPKMLEMSVLSRQSGLARKAPNLFGTELTRQEFSEALQLKSDSIFVRQMFFLADSDRNGFISYPEFIDLLVLMSKGTLESKMRMLFDMYDLDRNGLLDADEFSIMIRSLLDVANKDLSKLQLDRMVESMLLQGDVEGKAMLQFEDFYKIIKKHQHQLWSHFTFSGKGLRAQASVQDIGTLVGSPLSVESEQHSYGVLFLRYLENNWNGILIIVAFFLITAGLYTEFAIKYALFTEETGIRRVVDGGAAAARGAAYSLSFTFSMVLLSSCRNVFTYLRDSPIGYYVPFDSTISFHKIAAWTTLVLSVVHIVSHGVNFYHIGSQPPAVISCLLPEIFIASNFLPKFHYWVFGTVAGVTGVLLVIVLSVMYVFATQTARHRIFQAFRFSHGLFPVAYLLTVLHGTQRLLQEPFFFKFFLLPMVVYLINWIISIRTKSIPLRIQHAELLPSRVLHLCFKLPSNFRFHSGQWVRIACDELGVKEFHPFTMTSAPNERCVSLYVRAVGPWTNRLVNLFSKRISQQIPFPRVLLDGPYGSTHQNWFKFQSIVLVGAGIGVTPTSSVLKDLVYRVYQEHSDIATKEVHFVWIARNHQQFEWFIDILRDIEHQDVRHLIKIDIFITQLLEDFDIRTMMLYICEHHFQRLSNMSLFTGLRANTHFGRIDFEQYLLNVQNLNRHLKKVGVFSCGPKSMMKSVESACKKINLSAVSPAMVAHHEVF